MDSSVSSALFSGPVESAYCPYLEMLAFAIHPGTTESTTTVALDFGAQTLWITSQDNLKFPGVDVRHVHSVLDALEIFLLAARGGDEAAAATFWSGNCAIASKCVSLDDPGLSRTKKAQTRLNSKIDELYGSVFMPMAIALAKHAGIHEHIANLKEHIRAILIITDDQLFPKATATAGFHGESRIVRYYYINFLMGKSRELATAYAEGEAAIDKFLAMIDAAFGMAIFAKFVVGSSQKTCQGCAEMLNGYHLAHGIVGNRTAQWLNPITMNGMQGSTMIVKGKHLHAAAMVLTLAGLLH